MSSLDEKIGDLDAEAPVEDLGPSRQNPTNSGIFEREGFAWAADVFWVWDNLGSKMTKAKAGSHSRWALHKFAKSDMDRFVGQIMPRAMTLLEKAREKSGDGDDIVKAEEKSIRDLRNLLKAAVKESEQIAA